MKNIELSRYAPSVNKNYVWGTILVIGILTGIYYYGKKKGTNLPVTLPVDDAKNQNSLTESEKQTVTKIGNDINTELGYWSWGNIAPLWSNDQETALFELLGVSDKVFVAIFNYYNTNFVSPPDTLKTKLKSYNKWRFGYNPESDIIDNIILRMNRLGLQ